MDPGSIVGCTVGENVGSLLFAAGGRLFVGSKVGTEAVGNNDGLCPLLELPLTRKPTQDRVHKNTTTK